MPDEIEGAGRPLRRPAAMADVEVVRRGRWGHTVAMVSPAVVPSDPSRAQMITRGLRRRCPVCGTGGLFRRWMVMVDRCPRCALRFERVEGHWIGAIGINTMVSFAALLVVVAVGTALTVPSVPLVPMLAVAMTTALIFPLAFQPVSRTLWTAIDLAVRPLEPDDLG